MLPLGCALYHGPGFRMAELSAVPGMRVLPVEALGQNPASSDGASVLIVDQSLVEQTALMEDLPDHVVVVAADPATEAALGDAAELSLASATDQSAKLRTMRTAFQLSAARHNEVHCLSEVARHQKELSELNRIGMALMGERNRDVVLQQILTQVMRSTCSDAGALFLVEQHDDGSAFMRFKLVQADSVESLRSFPEEEWPVDSTSLVGHVAKTAQPLVLDDIRNLPADAPYSVNPFAERRGYWIKSMFSVPMIDHRGQVIGVLQLANRKSTPDVRIANLEDAERYALPYTSRDVQLGHSLAGQAAVLIENARLYAQIDELFECFVKAAVTAIDQRDPSTAGHSVRVATLVIDLAMAVERSARGAYRNIRFSPAQIRELRYAALLHDFGKVGVREAVLVKAKKLPPVLEERVERRFDLIRNTLQLHYERKRAQLSGDGTGDAVQALEAELMQELAQLQKFRGLIRKANEPAVLPDETAGLLVDVATHVFRRPDGRIVPYLEASELHYLRIPRGSLDEEERLEIEAHATQTFEFLARMPWTDDLRNIPTYASSHHEKLDGSGYPRRLQGDSIPIQTRMLAVADIFDALTAADRPYKAAVSPERALDIIQAEAGAGQLDAEVSEVMINSGVYRRILEEDWHRF